MVKSRVCPRSSEGAGGRKTPDWQDATGEHIGHMRAKSNAANRAAWPLEYSGAFRQGFRARGAAGGGPSAQAEGLA